MQHQAKYTISLLTLLILTILTWLLNISLGSVNIPFREVIAALFTAEGSKESWQYIIMDYRLPKAFTSVLAGSGLAVSGMLMQTMFRNPLAGPYVLGLSSGASLGVALVLMGASIFGGAASAILFSSWGLVIASSLGSLLVLMAVILASIRLKDTMAILIIGLMFASLSSAVVSVLAYFSPAAQLQQYVFWSYGSVGDLSWSELAILSIFWTTGILLAIFSIKNLNSLLLGRTIRQKPWNEHWQKQDNLDYGNKFISGKHHCLCRANCICRPCRATPGKTSDSRQRS